jgi:hypothetical protein
VEQAVVCVALLRVPAGPPRHLACLKGGELHCYYSQYYYKKKNHKKQLLKYLKIIKNSYVDQQFFLFLLFYNG